MGTRTTTSNETATHVLLEGIAEMATRYLNAAGVGGSVTNMRIKNTADPGQAPIDLMSRQGWDLEITASEPGSTSTGPVSF